MPLIFDAGEVTAALNSIADSMPEEVEKALYQEAQIERGESMKRTTVQVTNKSNDHRCLSIFRTTFNPKKNGSQKLCYVI